jgi:hypothetical protein
MTNSENTVINAYDILIGNQGYMKMSADDNNDIELAELKNLTIKLTPDMKEISLLNSVTKGKIMTNVNGLITFELNKIYSRFIPAVLESYKYLQLFCFRLEASIHKINSNDNETIYIGNCWLEQDIDIFNLNAEGELLSQKFTAGFQIESANFSDILDDQNDWESLNYKQIIEDIE